MSKLEWYPRYSGRALRGMECLTLEERGAYNTLLDMIYDRGEAVPDDEQRIAGEMRVSVRKWRVIRAALLVKNRIISRQNDRGLPVLTDDVAEAELVSRTARSRANAESGATGGRVSAEKRKNDKENNGDEQATAAAKAKLLTETETETEKRPHTLSADDVRVQSAEVSEAAGDALADMARCPGIASLAPLRSLLKGDPPCDWGEDVLPAVQSAAAWHRSRDGPGSMRSWTTAVRIAIENRDRRLAGLPPRNERPGPHPQAAAADPRRANTDSRRRAWLDLAEEQHAADAAPVRREPGGPGQHMPDRPRLAYAGEPAGDRDGDRGAGPALPGAEADGRGKPDRNAAVGG